jgi:hypothetical protein
LSLASAAAGWQAPGYSEFMFAFALALMRRRLYWMLLMLAWKVGRWAMSRRMRRAFSL